MPTVVHTLQKILNKDTMLHAPSLDFFAKSSFAGYLFAVKADVRFILAVSLDIIAIAVRLISVLLGCALDISVCVK
jgi:hypothetical protein